MLVKLKHLYWSGFPALYKSKYVVFILVSRSTEAGFVSSREFFKEDISNGPSTEKVYLMYISIDHFACT